MNKGGTKLIIFAKGGLMNKSFLFSILGAVLLLSGMACGSTSGITKPPSLLAGGLTEELLVNNTFRIYSPMVAFPTEKYYVYFLPRGEMKCQICHANNWRIKDSRTLEFVSGGKVFSSYTYNSSADALVGESRGIIKDEIKIWMER
jgi:hypothetical protein